MPSRGDTIDKAIALKSDEEVVARLRQRMPEAIKQLEDIACGNVPRNAREILKGIETLLRFSQPLPKTTIEHQGAVGISVVNPYAESTEGQGTESDGAISSECASIPALPAREAVVPVAPIRRRKPAPKESAE